MMFLDLAEAQFRAVLALLDQQGVPYSPALRLKQGREFLPHYDPASEVIGLPGADDRSQRLQRLMLYALLNVEHDAAFLPVYQLLVRWLIPHEIAHHLRSVNGRWSGDRDLEEQIANSFAAAVCDYNDAERAELTAFLASACAALDANLTALHITDADHPALYIYQQLRTIADALNGPVPPLDLTPLRPLHDR